MMRTEAALSFTGSKHSKQSANLRRSDGPGGDAVLGVPECKTSILAKNPGSVADIEMVRKFEHFNIRHGCGICN